MSADETKDDTQSHLENKSSKFLEQLVLSTPSFDIIKGERKL